jgi:hypothetical protein
VEVVLAANDRDNAGPITRYLRGQAKPNNTTNFFLLAATAAFSTSPIVVLRGVLHDLERELYEPRISTRPDLKHGTSDLLLALLRVVLGGPFLAGTIGNRLLRWGRMVYFIKPKIQYLLATAFQSC